METAFVMKLIPTLQTINPNVVDALCRLGDIAQVDEAYLMVKKPALVIQLVQSVDNGFQVSGVVCGHYRSLYGGSVAIDDTQCFIIPSASRTIGPYHTYRGS